MTPPRHAGRYAAGTVILFAAGFAAAAILGGGRGAWHALHDVPPHILPVLLTLSATNYLLRGLRWILFSHALRLRVPPHLNLLYYIAGFAMTATPGKLGEALRLWLMNRAHGAPYESTAALLVADRLSDAVAVSALVALTVGWFAHYQAVAALSVASVAAMAALALRPSLMLGLTDALFARLRRWPRLFVRARRAVRALQRLATPGVFGLALGLGILGWCAEAASFAVLLHALGVAMNPLAACFVFALGMTVGALSVLPGGLGSTEATMVALLASQGVPFGVALVATGVVRLTTLWFAIALGFVALPFALRGRNVHAALRPPAKIAMAE